MFNLQNPVKENVAMEPDNARLLAEFRKENERLQNVIAKRQVAHESELNKLRAEHAAELEKIKANSVTFNILPVAVSKG